jgi:hypothetical protein
LKDGNSTTGSNHTQTQTQTQTTTIINLQYPNYLFGDNDVRSVIFYDHTTTKSKTTKKKIDISKRKDLRKLFFRLRFRWGGVAG